MVERHPELEEETGYSMLLWIARWGEAFADDQGRVELFDNIELQDAMELLVENAVFKKDDQFTFTFIASKPQMKKPCDLDDILYIFHGLGGWYGYGVKYQQQGFKVEASICRIFDNLVRLDYCAKRDGFYVWTDKTFSLNRQGWGIYTPIFDDYLKRKKEEFFRNRKALSNMVAEEIVEIPFDDWDNDKRLEEFVESWIKNKWREKPTVWPEVIPLD